MIGAMIRGSDADAHPLTRPDDWAAYHSLKSLEQLRAASFHPCAIEDYLNGRGGSARTIFELGCGSSHVLARAAALGWQVGGIDFNEQALAGMRQLGGTFIEADVLSFDTAAFAGSFDLLVSFGFMEHFKNPAALISRWLPVLKPDGIMITTVPNLCCLNGWILRRFQRSLWDQHVVHTAQSLDQAHIAAGARVIAPAQLCGRYDMHWLIPWDVFQRQLPRSVFLGLKVASRLLVQEPLRVLPEGTRFASTMILGVYGRP